MFRNVGKRAAALDPRALMNGLAARAEGARAARRCSVLAAAGDAHEVFVARGEGGVRLPSGADFGLEHSSSSSGARRAARGSSWCGGRRRVGGPRGEGRAGCQR